MTHEISDDISQLLSRALLHMLTILLAVDSSNGRDGWGRV